MECNFQTRVAKDMDNNDTTSSVQGSSLPEDQPHHQAYWNQLLPYPVEDGHQYLTDVIEDVKKALANVDLVELSCCAARLEQYSVFNFFLFIA